MAESVYNRRQSIALASLALSVPTIPPGSARHLHRLAVLPLRSNTLEWQRDVERCNHFGKSHPYHRDGLSIFRSARFPGQGNTPTGAAATGARP
jgi:hypothetical protein